MNTLLTLWTNTNAGGGWSEPLHYFSPCTKVPRLAHMIIIVADVDLQDDLKNVNRACCKD